MLSVFMHYRSQVCEATARLDEYALALNLPTFTNHDDEVVCTRLILTPIP